MTQISAMGSRFASILARLGYVGACTVETLMDAREEIFFLECNPRLQVEHPITEAIMGIDLVEWQIRLAAGERLRLPTPESRPGGVAIECRVHAEDPARGFEPCPGWIHRLVLPFGEGIRVDTHLENLRGTGEPVPPHYDPLLCKIIAWGHDRDEARARLEEAVSATVIEGVTTNLNLLRTILGHPSFREGRVDTGFVTRNLTQLLPVSS